MYVPLPEQLRPTSVAEFFGHEELLAKAPILQKALTDPEVRISCIFWGPPGTGKTTLARLIARVFPGKFVEFSATTGSISDVRQIVKDAIELRKESIPTLVFCDEIHRFNKTQQDAFLPHLENGLLLLIGATTENPSFSVNSALLSRLVVFELKPHSTESLTQIATRAFELLELHVSVEQTQRLAAAADGDSRVLLSNIELLAKAAVEQQISDEQLEQLFASRQLLYDRTDQRYAIISAFIKSIRGSDPDAGLYWLARLLKSGEDPMYLTRRLMILAAEDIGNADPAALTLAVSTHTAVSQLGLPEGRIPLAQCVTYLALAPKSNAAYLGINAALECVTKTLSLPVPKHIQNAPTQLMRDLGFHAGYKYAHDSEDGYIPQQYLPDSLSSRTFYHPTTHGFEEQLRERLKTLRTLAATSTAAAQPLATIQVPSTTKTRLSQLPALKFPSTNALSLTVKKE